jgi:hypothetical protein
LHATEHLFSSLSRLAYDVNQIDLIVGESERQPCLLWKALLFREKFGALPQRSRLTVTIALAWVASAAAWMGFAFCLGAMPQLRNCPCAIAQAAAGQ